MSNFVFALNATLPIFLVILLGWFLARVHILNDAFCKAANAYVFTCALPVSMFQSVSQMDLYHDFDLRFCIFCALATTAIFLGVWGVSALVFKNRGLIGAFSQVAARSSAAILGIAFAENLYGDAGMVPMMIVAAVPFFNIYSVLILTFSPHVDEEGHLLPKETGGGAAVRRACRNVITNPIILGILIAIPFALLQVQLPEILNSALDTVGGTASPVALLVIGASFSGRAALKKVKPTIAATAVKLFLLPAIVLPIAAWMGFRESEMVAILILSGSPTTVSCYVMAKQMKGDGVLTSSVIMLATLVSSVSLTFWLFMLRTFGLV